jgi:hypothetical protein
MHEISQFMSTLSRGSLTNANITDVCKMQLCSTLTLPTQLDGNRAHSMLTARANWSQTTCLLQNRTPIPVTWYPGGHFVCHYFLNFTYITKPYLCVFLNMDIANELSINYNFSYLRPTIFAFQFYYYFLQLIKQYCSQGGWICDTWYSRLSWQWSSMLWPSVKWSRVVRSTSTKFMASDHRI